MIRIFYLFLRCHLTYFLIVYQDSVTYYTIGTLSVANLTLNVKARAKCVIGGRWHLLRVSVASYWSSASGLIVRVRIFDWLLTEQHFFGILIFCYGAMVKWLRRRLLRPKSRVRSPLALLSISRCCLKFLWNLRQHLFLWQKMSRRVATFYLGIYLNKTNIWAQLNRWTAICNKNHPAWWTSSR